ncbi:hypothetical protein D3C80_670130 [compost metagenome]
MSMVCFWPILLKKSSMVCASEKYALEIEIFTFGRGFRTRISRSSVQKRRSRLSMTRQFGQTDFFNRIGRSATVAFGSIACSSSKKSLIKTHLRNQLHKRSEVTHKASLTHIGNCRYAE